MEGYTMRKLFSVLSWNVEHFKGTTIRRVTDVIQKIKELNPDVVGLYEVEGKEVYDELTKTLSNYTFHITEGPQTQEILVGARQGIPAFFTQKIEFKEENKYLRPGALLSFKINSVDYALLFLHTKSGNDPLGLGLRDDMFKKACKFRKTLDDAVGKKWGAHYIFMGDLNTMGMDYPYDRGIEAGTEIKKLAEKEALKVKMNLLKKDEPATFWNGSKSTIPKSDLDQVVATENLKFKKYNGADVTVLGWPKESTDKAKDDWIKKYSDHGILYFEVVS